MTRRICSLCCVVALLLVTTSGCFSTIYQDEGRKIIAAFVPENGEVMDEAAWEDTKEVISNRLRDADQKTYGVYADTENNRLVVELVWPDQLAEGEEPAVIVDLQKRAEVGFYKGTETKPATDENGNEIAVPSGECILTGVDVVSAEAEMDKLNDSIVVNLTLNEKGKAAFAKATEQVAMSNGTISIWVDGNMVSNPRVNVPITDGKVRITGLGSMEEAEELACGLQGGQLPFDLKLSSLEWQSVSAR